MSAGKSVKDTKQAKSQRPTLEDVAEEAGVSRSLVSLALRDSSKVSSEKYGAVLSAVEKLKYRPNITARNLAQQRSHVIGIVVNDLRNPFLAETIVGLQEVAEKVNYQVFISMTQRTVKAEVAAVDNFLNYQADGIVMIGPQTDHTELTSKATEAPVVAIGATLQGIDTVVNDDLHGAELAVQHLASLGHTKIAHIGGGSGGGAAARVAGYKSAMKSLNLKPEIFQAEYDADAAREAATQLLQASQVPTAVFCANDYMAGVVLDVFASSSLAVPDDISVVGYDNNIMSGTQIMNLTTIDQPSESMGRTAMQHLLSRIDGYDGPARTEVVEPSLVVRGSTSEPSRSSA